MRLSFSNIAWDIGDEATIAADLAAGGLDLVDVAPGKYFPDPQAATAADIAAVRDLWAARGFAIRGMQGLLFGTSGLNLFHDPDEAMLRRLSAICRIGGGLGAAALTFGSPKNRDRTGLTDAEAEAVAAAFFRRLGDAAGEAGVVVCLEPNPAIYDCNFMTTTPAAAQVVEAVDHPAIGLQLDVGAMALNGEDPADIVARFGHLARHVHASEPMLAPLGDKGADHAAAGAALRAVRPDLPVAVEMATPRDEPARGAVARALAVAQRFYGDAAC